MSDEPIVKGSWPLVEMRDGQPLWHVSGTNPPEYAPDTCLEALWHEGQTRMAALKAPFPYFGGKSKIAALVWERFGQVQNYVEPFFGSGAVLLGCPTPGHTETVNDADGLLANFWRATAHDAEQVAHYADWPVNEADLHARHRWLVDRRPMVESLMADPEWYDAKAAGWWVWGISQWIGTGWCPVTSKASEKMPYLSRPGSGLVNPPTLPTKIPHMGGNGDVGRGVHAGRLARKMPFIASPAPDRAQHGLGVHGKRLSQQMPMLKGGQDGGSYMGVHRESFQQGALYDYFRALQARLRRTRVVCGDFERILGPSITWRHGTTAVFLDPPYADAEHAVTYSGGGNVWERVCAWCEANGDNPALRIALCGYADTWQAPAGWASHRWRTSGGYGSQGNARGRENANREVVWFSPACLDPAELARDAMSRPLSVREADYAGTLFDLEAA